MKLWMFAELVACSSPTRLNPAMRSRSSTGKSDDRTSTSTEDIPSRAMCECTLGLPVAITLGTAQQPAVRMIVDRFTLLLSGAQTTTISRASERRRGSRPRTCLVIALTCRSRVAGKERSPRGRVAPTTSHGSLEGPVRLVCRTLAGGAHETHFAPTTCAMRAHRFALGSGLLRRAFRSVGMLVVGGCLTVG